MTCSWCDRVLPEGYVQAVDWRGQPIEPLCRWHELAVVFSRAKRREEALRGSK